jgi:hypothetical protein
MLNVTKFFEYGDSGVCGILNHLEKLSSKREGGSNYTESDFKVDASKAALLKFKKYYDISSELCTIGLGVMHTIVPSEPFEKILDKLNAAYGFGNIDPSIILNQLRDIRFHPSNDPSITLNEIDLRLMELESAGGAISEVKW